MLLFSQTADASSLFFFLFLLHLLISSCRSLHPSFNHSLQGCSCLKKLHHWPRTSVGRLSLSAGNISVPRVIPSVTPRSSPLQGECLQTARTPAACWECVAGLWSSNLSFNSRMRPTLCECFTQPSQHRPLG